MLFWVQAVRGSYTDNPNYVATAGQGQNGLTQQQAVVSLPYDLYVVYKVLIPLCRHSWLCQAQRNIPCRPLQAMRWLHTSPQNAPHTLILQYYIVCFTAMHEHSSRCALCVPSSYVS